MSAVRHHALRCGATQFRSTATMIAEGIEDHTRGEVENLTRSIEGDELLHMTFTRGGKRYRVEMREDK